MRQLFMLAGLLGLAYILAVGPNEFAANLRYKLYVHRVTLTDDFLSWRDRARGP